MNVQLTVVKAELREILDILQVIKPEHELEILRKLQKLMPTAQALVEETRDIASQAATPRAFFSCRKKIRSCSTFDFRWRLVPYRFVVVVCAQIGGSNSDARTIRHTQNAHPMRVQITTPAPRVAHTQIDGSNHDGRTRVPGI
jgi:hypothetical protein